MKGFEMLKAFLEMLNQPLMIDPGYMRLLRSACEAGLPDKAKGLFINAPDPVAFVQSQLAAAPAKSSGKMQGVTAVIPIYGSISQHSSWMQEIFGGVSCDSLGEAVDMVMREDRIANVVFDWSCYGGEVGGIKAMADTIYACRGMKPMASVVNSAMCSAGYYIGAAADRVYCAPMSITGSVGCYMVHMEYSKAFEQGGAKATVVRSPDRKAGGNPYEPLSPEELASMQASVSEITSQFQADVAKYRGCSVAQVKEKFGDGGTLTPKCAVDSGAADGIATLKDVVGWMQSGKMARSLAQKCSVEQVEMPRMDARDVKSLEMSAELAARM